MMDHPVIRTLSTGRLIKPTRRQEFMMAGAYKLLHLNDRLFSEGSQAAALDEVRRICGQAPRELDFIDNRPCTYWDLRGFIVAYPGNIEA